MITDKDWHEIIAKCQGVSKPNEVAHILLAAATYMTERNSKPAIRNDSIGYSGDTEFSNLVNGKNPELVLSVFEELMDTLSVLSPKLYKAVMDKLKFI